ncbi:MAG: ABC transporter permease [Fimbriimonadaceae bacterium]
MFRALLAKELLELVRDRRVVVSAVVLPVFLIGLFVYLFASLQSSLQRPKAQTVALAGAEDHPIRAAILKTDLLRALPVPDRQAAEHRVRRGDAKAAVLLGPFDRSVLESGRSWTVEVLFDPNEPLAPLVTRTVREIAAGLNAAAASAVLQRSGLDRNLLEPIRVVERPLDPEKGLGETMLLSILPYLVVIWAFYGGMSVASDMVAGEKERQTLETLLVSPATRREIALAKFAALTVVCLAGSVATLLAVALLSVVRLPGMPDPIPGGAGLTILGALAVLVVVAPLAMFFASVLLAISTLARNVREAQTHLTLVSFVVLAPAIYSQFLGLTGMEGSVWARWTPILNAAVCVRQSLLGRLQAGDLAATFSVSLVLAAAGLWLSVRLMEREAILRRT